MHSCVCDCRVICYPENMFTTPILERCIPMWCIILDRIGIYVYVLLLRIVRVNSTRPFFVNLSTLLWKSITRSQRITANYSTYVIHYRGQYTWYVLQPPEHLSIVEVSTITPLNKKARILCTWHACCIKPRVICATTQGMLKITYGAYYVVLLLCTPSAVKLYMFIRLLCFVNNGCSQYTGKVSCVYMNIIYICFYVRC